MSRSSGSYDYIVVGSGSAGSVLSYRLGRAGHSVAVIEAGDRGDAELVADPLAYGRFRRTRHDWNYDSLPQAETDGRTHVFPRGKLWGGSSSVNGMVYIRGARTDFDAWARAAGEQWGWDRAVRAFEELEAEPGQLAATLPGPERTLWHEAFLAACARHGLAARGTFDDGVLDGAGWTRLTMRSGRRRGAHEAFLLPALATSQVDMNDECTALRVLFDGDRAFGVECRRGRETVRLTAEREVIVCCGALNSPQLLLRSGIGAPDELSLLGIPAVSAVPGVGRNLSDHLVTGAVFTADEGVPAGPTAVAAFARSGGQVSGSDLQLWLNRRRHSAEHDAGDSSFTILCALVRPASRGTVRLAPGGGHARPVIDTGYLTDKADLDALVQGVRLARELGRVESFSSVRPVEAQPGGSLVSDDELAGFVRRSVTGQHHPMGTCRMGSDDESVVDPCLRVRGVHGLRVADASVFPFPVGTGPDASTQMVAWRAADLILSGD
ncbi:GMC family oxidoreductase [Kitasatospora sp. NBC_01266]|uniref:GMC family oxidoreductase n=1 Tax=Kitasatospora sp. NBC_01266 TaxID=2903572 RepID=UPI002E380627|nr:GMC family oxidoreductase [Kitasatospora sp. NBC_01266]